MHSMFLDTARPAKCSRIQLFSRSQPVLQSWDCATTGAGVAAARGLFRNGSDKVNVKPLIFYSLRVWSGLRSVEDTRLRHRSAMA